MTRRRIDRTQGAWIKHQLLAGQRLTHTNLINDCGGNGGWRLGAVIYRLARDKKDPLPILRTYSGKERKATYWLDPEFKRSRQPAQMRLPI